MDMRSPAALALVAAALVAAAPAGGSSAAAAPRTALTITYFEDAREPATRVAATLRCNPVGGTHPRRSLACRGLARVGLRGLRPLPRGVACTEIYGGPQAAVVQGVVDGQRVWVRLKRDNGCEISRWNRLAFLLPVVWTASG